MKLRSIALLIAASAGLASCEAPSVPVAASEASYGALATTNMSDYFYPREAGWTYVYKHTIEEYDGGAVSRTIAGPYDTLKTLGYQSIISDLGDSVFAFVVKYRVLQSKNTSTPFNLHYVTRSNRNKGGFIIGNNPTGFANTQNIQTSARAIDTILYVVEGPLRDVIDDYNSTDARTWRTDIVFYTAKADSIILLYREGNTYRRTRMVWFRDFDKHDEWRYGLWDYSTYAEVRDENTNVDVDAGTFRSVKLDVTSQDINTDAEELKWYGYQAGLVKQKDTWHVTSDGTSFQKRTRTRELISRTKQ